MLYSSSYISTEKVGESMREFASAMGMVALIGGFYAFVIYPDVEYKNHPRLNKCIDECYLEDIRLNGTVTEQLRAKKLAAQGDPFASIRSLWSGCAACHGANGEGMAVFPKLAGQSAEYITGRLNTYKARGEVGGMSATMWSQAALLTNEEIKTLGDYIAAELK